MATLNIRNLPDEVHAALRVRAAHAGVSMEAEAREIIARSVRAESQDAQSAPAAVVDWVRNLYGGEPPENVVDDLIAERRSEAAQE